MLFSACLAAVKSRPLLHHCVVILFWSSGIMEWHHSWLLMNSFNKTEAAVFSCRLCFLRAFHFISLISVSNIVKLFSRPTFNATARKMLKGQSKQEKICCTYGTRCRWERASRKEGDNRDDNRQARGGL